MIYASGLYTRFNSITDTENVLEAMKLLIANRYTDLFNILRQKVVFLYFVNFKAYFQFTGGKSSHILEDGREVGLLDTFVNNLRAVVSGQFKSAIPPSGQGARSHM